MRRTSRRTRVFPALLLVCCALSFLAWKFPRAALPPVDPNSPYSVQFLDVGQGDAALLCLGGDYVLIDAGPTKAADGVVEALRQQGVTRLRAVIASHPHEDHIGGMSAVLHAFPVDAFYLPHATANTVCFRNMLDEFEKQSITPTVPAPGDSFAVGGANLTFLSPDPAATFEEVNNASLVVRADIGAQRILFVGDAEAPALEALAASGADLACDIYKVGHHGSRDSSPAAFLAAARPRTAVISCGKDNSFGHPHAQTLRRLQDVGAEILKTAGGGTVTLPLAPPQPPQKEIVS